MKISAPALPADLLPYAEHLLADLRVLAAMQPALDAYAAERRALVRADPGRAANYTPSREETAIRDAYDQVRLRARRSAAVLHACGALSDTVLSHLL